MFRTLSQGDSISVALRKLLQGGGEKSGHIQVCNKGSRQSEHQRSGIKLRKLAFCVWEDASLWAHWIHFLHMHFSCLGPNPVSLFILLLAFPQLLSNHRGGGSISWIAVLGALIHIWRPEIADSCDIFLLIDMAWEISTSHPLKPQEWQWCPNTRASGAEAPDLKSVV